MAEQKDISTIGKGFKSLNEDRNAARKKKSRRMIIIATIIIVAVNLFVVWWWPHSLEFGTSGIFKEADVKAKAEEAIRLLEKDDYKALIAMSDEAMQQIFGEDNRAQWDTAKQSVGDDWGEFVSFDKMNLAELKQTGKLYTTVQIEATYKNVKVNYSMSFDKDMKLSGMYLMKPVEE